MANPLAVVDTHGQLCSVMNHTPHRYKTQLQRTLTPEWEYCRTYISRLVTNPAEEGTPSATDGLYGKVAIVNDDETSEAEATEYEYIWNYNLIHLTPEVLTALCDADTLTDD